MPDFGGYYSEGMLGQPHFINPILAHGNDVDMALSRIIFSSLIKHDSQGSIILDLIDKYELSNDRKTYTFYLKPNIFWHDSKKLTSDDVIFTVKTIQDPIFKSPLRPLLQGVKIEKIDNLCFKLVLINPYTPFLNNLDFGILPKHIWQDISPNNFALAQANLEPVGSGPFKFKNLTKDKQGVLHTLELEVNKNYFFQKPYLDKIIFKFFQTEEEIIKAYQIKSILGLSFISSQNQDKIQDNLKIYNLEIPRYFAVFLNQTKSNALADQNVRQALTLAVDKQQIIDQVFKGQGIQINTPLAEYYNAEHEFNLEKARNILKNNKWLLNEQGIRQKQDQELSFSLITTDWPGLEQTAQILKKQWAQIGANLNVQINNPLEVQRDYLRPREYEAILFGQALGFEPDLFAFWHSSQITDPGRNLALYNNPKVDQFLIDIRSTFDQEERKQKYYELLKTLDQDLPAIFLVNPYYLYGVNKKIKGIDLEKIQAPHERFNQVEEWYVRTKTIRE